MRKLFVYLISFYQKRISPHKGFSCAHSGLHKGDSCSEYSKKQIHEKGVFASIKDIRLRFDECRDAANIIQQRRPLLAQRGDCDLGLSGCDSCDMSGKNSLPYDCLSSSCDFFHSDKKNRRRDSWIIFFVVIILIISYFYFK